MNKPYILGITGKKGCGKETLARKIKEELKEYTVYVLPVADYVKDVIAVMLNIDRDLLDNREWKEDECIIDGWGTNREVMQGVGQALRDSFRSTVWIDLWLKDYNAMLNHSIYSPPDLIIIPDIRLDNEAEMVHELGGKIIKLGFGLFSDKKYETDDPDVTERGIRDELIQYRLGSIDENSFHLFQYTSLPFLIHHIKQEILNDRT